MFPISKAGPVPTLAGHACMRWWQSMLGWKWLQLLSADHESERCPAWKSSSGDSWERYCPDVRHHRRRHPGRHLWERTAESSPSW